MPKFHASRRVPTFEGFRTVSKRLNPVRDGENWNSVQLMVPGENKWPAVSTFGSSPNKKEAPRTKIQARTNNVASGSLIIQMYLLLKCPTFLRETYVYNCGIVRAWNPNASMW